MGVLLFSTLPYIRAYIQVCVCVCVCVLMCVCVCVCVLACTYIYIYIYIYMCVCVCVCVLTYLNLVRLLGDLYNTYVSVAASYKSQSRLRRGNTSTKNKHKQYLFPRIITSNPWKYCCSFGTTGALLEALLPTALLEDNQLSSLFWKTTIITLLGTTCILFLCVDHHFLI